MRHAKSFARKRVIKGLYYLNLTEKSIDTIDFFTDDLALEMITDIKKNEEEINVYIKKYLKKWSLFELNPVNLAILQLGVYEILEKKLPIAIIISQALELSAKYSEDKSKNFIHYTLDNINKEINELS